MALTAEQMKEAMQTIMGNPNVLRDFLKAGINNGDTESPEGRAMAFIAAFPLQSLPEGIRKTAVDTIVNAAQELGSFSGWVKKAQASGGDVSPAAVKQGIANANKYSFVKMPGA